MLDEKDIRCLQGMLENVMDSRLKEMETRMDARFEAMETRFEKLETRFEKMETRFEKLETRFEKTEKMLLDEMEVVQTFLENKILKVNRNVEELQQYYRITKLENDNTALILKMIEALRDDVEALKQKTA